MQAFQIQDQIRVAQRAEALTWGMILGCEYGSVDKNE
jgi:hypothetical protein